MKKNGFTLVELLVVITLISIVTIIAVPSAIELGRRVKEKSYISKIELLEKNAINYGQTNINSVKSGYNPVRGGNFTCKFDLDSKGNITKIELRPQNDGYNELKTLEENEYWCFRLMLEELVEEKNISWDEENACSSCELESDKSNYDKIIINPYSNYIINKCYMYLYYKNNRVYSYYDVSTCDIKSDTPQDGQEYRRIN